LNLHTRWSSYGTGVRGERINNMGTPDVEWLAEGLREQTGAFSAAVDGMDAWAIAG
jgi:hypothetical protein